MQLKQLIENICEYAVKNDICNTAMGGLSLYDVNFKQDNLYPLIYVTPATPHTISNNTINYSLSIYFIDRLLRDNENNIDIVNASVGKLQQIINIIKSFDDVLKVDDNYNITNFADTQRLSDNVAGGFVTLSITVQNMQGVCAIDAILPTINVIKIKYQNKDINITENGDYNVTYDNGYNALKEVNVNVNIDTESFYQEGFSKGKTEGIEQGKEEQKSLIQPITITENGTFTNENGFSPINVNLDLESIYNNGYNEGYNNGEVNGIEQGKEEQKSLLTSINITENGNYTNENGYNEVIVNVGGTPKPKLPNGISLENSTFSTIDMSKQDWSNVYDWSYMFNYCTNLTEIQNFPTDVEILASASMFRECSNLVTIPELDTSNVITMESMFNGCIKLISIPELNTSNVINMSNMFYYCQKLTSIPELDTSNVTDMQYMFYRCNNLTSIPLLDTSNVTDMSSMFRNCPKLNTIPPINTSNVTTMYYMFYECTNLVTIPELDTSNVTDMQYMFSYCNKLTTISLIDISNVTTMEYMFNACYKLEEIKFKGNPQYLTKITNMFYYTGRDVEDAKMYYPQEFETNYQVIIDALPTNWTAIPY